MIPFLICGPEPVFSHQAHKLKENCSYEEGPKNPSMYDNDSHSPSPKGAGSHLLRYPKLGEEEEYTYISRTVEYSTLKYRQWCMTCLIGQRLGRKIIGRLGKRRSGEEGPGKTYGSEHSVHSLKSLLSPWYSLPESSHHRSSRHNQVDK